MRKIAIYASLIVALFLPGLGLADVCDQFSNLKRINVGREAIAEGMNQLGGNSKYDTSGPGWRFNRPELEFAFINVGYNKVTLKNCKRDCISVHAHNDSYEWSTDLSIAMPADELMCQLRGMDSILISTSRGSHMSVIWSVNRGKKEVLLLEEIPQDSPFLRSNSEGRIGGKIVPGRKGASLISVPWDDLKSVIIAARFMVSRNEISNRFVPASMEEKKRNERSSIILARLSVYCTLIDCKPDDLSFNSTHGEDRLLALGLLAYYADQFHRISINECGDIPCMVGRLSSDAVKWWPTDEAIILAYEAINAGNPQFAADLIYELEKRKPSDTDHIMLLLKSYALAANGKISESLKEAARSFNSSLSFIDAHCPKSFKIGGDNRRIAKIVKCESTIECMAANYCWADMSAARDAMIMQLQTMILEGINKKALWDIIKAETLFTDDQYVLSLAAIALSEANQHVYALEYSKASADNGARATSARTPHFSLLGDLLLRSTPRDPANDMPIISYVLVPGDLLLQRLIWKCIGGKGDMLNWMAQESFKSTNPGKKCLEMIKATNER